MKKTLSTLIATAVLSAGMGSAGAFALKRDSNNINDWAVSVTKTEENAFVIQWASGDEEYLQPQWYEESQCEVNNPGNYTAQDLCLAKVKTKYKWVRILYRTLQHT